MFEDVYEQYWLHARHQETQRLSFTNIYAIIVAGVFAFLGVIYKLEITDEYDYLPLKVLLIIFLLILSLFGYLLVLTWNYPFVLYSRLAEKLSKHEWDLPKPFLRFENKEYKKSIIRATTLFILFYSFMTIIMVAILLFILVPELLQLNILNILLIFVLLLLIFIILFIIYRFYHRDKKIGKLITTIDQCVEQYYKENIKKSG